MDDVLKHHVKAPAALGRQGVEGNLVEGREEASVGLTRLVRALAAPNGVGCV